MKKIILAVCLSALCACQGQSPSSGTETNQTKKTTKAPPPRPKDDPTLGMTPEQIAKYNSAAAFHSDIAVGKEAAIMAATTHKIAGSKDTIEFVKINKDSRCPSGAQCVWAGEVEVELKATSGGKSETLTLGTKSITWKGYQFTMKDVLPHPSSKQPAEGLPRLLLQVDKAGSPVEVSVIPGAEPTAQAPLQVTAATIETPTKPLVELPPAKPGTIAQPVVVDPATFIKQRAAAKKPGADNQTVKPSGEAAKPTPTN